MLETTLITFREGLEASLVVAIMLAYLKKSGQYALMQPVYTGIGAALILSVTTGWHVAELAENPIWEGALAIISGIMVASFTAYVMRTAGNIRSEITQKLQDEISYKTGIKAWFGVFIFTTLMIAREGMETALMLGSISAEMNTASLTIGALFGFSLVALIGYMWTKQSQLINLRLFMQATGIFLILFAVHLFINGVHELSEAFALPLLNDEIQLFVHDVTEPLGPESRFADLITLSLLAVPCGWIGLSYLKTKFFKPTASAMAAE